MDYVKLIENINQELYELIPENAPEIISFIEENPPLTFKSCGYAHNISFFGLLIWCSENDERPYENENDPELCDHIPLERWIWKEMMKILSLMNQFNEVIKRRIEMDDERLMDELINRNLITDKGVITISGLEILKDYIKRLRKEKETC